MSLSKEQEYALTKFRAGENLFITGAGGTGKTKLIKHLIMEAKDRKKKVQVCALTGCASVLLNCNARTIHAWSGIRLAKGNPEQIIESVVKNKMAQKSWKKIHVLIIDEISMMSKKIFEILDTIGKIIRTNNTPFGGIQVIFTGDFCQLPPVGTYGEPDTAAFCFESPLWYRTFIPTNHIELVMIFRQNDPAYIDILIQIRKGEIDEKSIEILKKYVKREYKEGVQQPTKLFPIRAKAEFVNSTMFDKLDEDEYQYESTVKTDCLIYQDTGKAIPVDIIKKCGNMTQKEREYEIEYLQNNIPCERVIKLKKGSSVLCIANLDLDNGICNGSQGVVIEIIEKAVEPDIIVVRFENGIVKQMLPHYWQSEEYSMIAVKQYPLILSWAMTIHKIQGATLSMAEMDIGESVFEYGQTYVALSRIKSLEGLYLSAFNPAKIRANPKVITFYEKIQKIPEKADNDDEKPAKLQLEKYAYVESISEPTIKIIKL
jgi:ATP-dependent DNA helicase PIF1